VIAHPRDSFYIHCDGALLSPMMPSIDFTQKAYAKPFNQVPLQVARYSVGQCPAAVSRCRKGNKQARHLEQHIDTTIMMMGNRNRQSALVLVVNTPQKDSADITCDDIHCSMETAGYLPDKLTVAGLTSAMRFEFSVVLEKHTDQVFIQR
jgi:hypothetical protein